MTDLELDLEMQPYIKISLQEQRKLKAEQDALVQQKIKQLQAKMEKSSLPQSALKLRPINQATQEQQRLLNREAILNLSRNLRNTHLSNPFALSFQIKGPVFDEDLTKKLRIAINAMRQRQLTTKHHFEHKIADQKFEQQHHPHSRIKLPSM